MGKAAPLASASEPGLQGARRGAPSAETECVAADAIALRHLADASHRIVSYSQCQTAQSLHPRCILASGFFSLPLLSFVAADPPSEGDWRSAQRRPALYGRAVRRDATLARQ